MYHLNFKHHFDAAHFLKNYKGKCKNLHGHRWEVEVKASVKYLKDDMVIDFAILKSVIDDLDHKCLNDIVEFNPTAENIVKYIYVEIAKIRPLINLEVTVWEAPNSSITYGG